MITYDAGDEFELITLETCRESGVSRPRVRALSYFPREMRVDFPVALRTEYPIGTRFRANVKVCQKHNVDGSLKGVKYLYADKKTIVLVKDFTPSQLIFALQKNDSKSGRAYDYVLSGGSEELEFGKLREKALKASGSTREGVLSESYVRKRSGIIKLYALARSEGNCEACDEPAPFIRRKNGEPYLEVHHIKELSQGGTDSILNVAAICPNCHARVTHGDDASMYNQSIFYKIKAKEDDIAERYDDFSSF